MIQRWQYMGNILICDDRGLVSCMYKTRHCLGCKFKIFPENSGAPKIEKVKGWQEDPLTGKFKFTCLWIVNIWLTSSYSRGSRLCSKKISNHFTGKISSSNIFWFLQNLIARSQGWTRMTVNENCNFCLHLTANSHQFLFYLSWKLHEISINFVINCETILGPVHIGRHYLGWRENISLSQIIFFVRMEKCFLIYQVKLTAVV